MAGNGHGVGTPAPRHFFLLAETYKHPGLPAISAGPADRQTALPSVSVRPSKFEAPRPVVSPPAAYHPPPPPVPSAASNARLPARPPARRGGLAFPPC